MVPPLRMATIDKVVEMLTNIAGAMGHVHTPVSNVQHQEKDTKTAQHSPI